MCPTPTSRLVAEHPRFGVTNSVTCFVTYADVTCNTVIPHHAKDEVRLFASKKSHFYIDVELKGNVDRLTQTIQTNKTCPS
jgi:hypothetical protein